MQHALGRGITYFDTAESYQAGSSEETIGRALAGRRDHVLLASKQSAGAHTKRAELFETVEEGAMLSVPLPAAELLGVLESSVSIAVVNAPALSVASDDRK